MTRFARVCFGAICILVVLLAAAAPADSGRVPQRVLLGVTDDPAHSQTVTWRTPEASSSPQAQIAPWSGDPAIDKNATTVTAAKADCVTGAGATVTHYTATFTQLAPGKDYAYRVGDGSVWSEWFHIRTASAAADPFRFIYVGDAQVDVKSRWSRTIREAYRRAPDAALILHAGDLINNGYDDALWGEWCDALGFIGAMTPSVAAVGNHDMNLPKGAAGQPTAAFPLWKAHFSFPQNGPAGVPALASEAYWFDYQGVRFICLEGNAYSPEDYDAATRELVKKKQVEWLEPLLAKNPNRWTVLLHHEPMYGVGKNADNPELRAALLPLYDKYHVDLVLQGHDHVYARSQKLAGGKVVGASEPGVVYVVSVSGPKMYPFNQEYQALMRKTLANTQIYQVIEVSANNLRLKAYSVDGAWVDGFELKKNAAGRSTLSDLNGPEK